MVFYKLWTCVGWKFFNERGNHPCPASLIWLMNCFAFIGLFALFTCLVKIVSESGRLRWWWGPRASMDSSCSHKLWDVIDLKDWPMKYRCIVNHASNHASIKLIHGPLKACYSPVTFSTILAFDFAFNGIEMSPRKGPNWPLCPMQRLYPIFDICVHDRHGAHHDRNDELASLFAGCFLCLDKKSLWLWGTRDFNRAQRRHQFSPKTAIKLNPHPTPDISETPRSARTPKSLYSEYSCWP